MGTVCSVFEEVVAQAKSRHAQANVRHSIAVLLLMSFTVIKFNPSSHAPMKGKKFRTACNGRLPLPIFQINQIIDIFLIKRFGYVSLMESFCMSQAAIHSPFYTPLHILKIQSLSLNVRLGCSSEERAVRQEVRVSAELRFFDPPKGVQSDDLKDTISYAVICETLREFGEGREFQLIEKMAGEFYRLTKDLVEGRAAVSLTVHKVKPPVSGLLGGAEYRVGDFA
jgi:dihydroneopterin aldolase